MVRIVVLGDAALDVSVVPVRPPVAAGDVPATVRLGVGGQAANVAVRLARRGIEVTLASPLAGDLTGELLRDRLVATGVALWPLPAERSTTVVALVDRDGERSMLSDRVSLDPSGIAPLVEGANWVHCSGYALADDASGEALSRALRRRHDGAVLSVAGGSFEADAPHAARIRSRLDAAGVDLLVLDRGEAASVVGAPDAPLLDLVRGLGALAAIAVVTAGTAGSAAVCDGSVIEVAASPLAERAVDATGAGDAYAAALIAELHEGWPPDASRLRSAMEAASAAGARVAMTPGAQAAVAGERA
jgi:sugar/nucleoside kinase (ribokinase family)